MFNELYVVKTALAVQDRIRQSSNLSFVITSQFFFDNIRLLAFEKNFEYTVDEEALFVCASEALALHQATDLLSAFKYVQVIREIEQAGYTVAQLVSKLDNSDCNKILKKHFFVLEFIDTKRQNLKKTDNYTSLQIAAKTLRNNKELPFFLERFKAIIFDDFALLTPVEKNILTELEKRNIAIICNSAASNNSFILDDKWNFDDKLCVQTYWAADLVDEAKWVAGFIANLRLSAGGNTKFAIAFRSVDDRAIFFRDALNHQGILVKDFRGRKLVETSAGRLLVDLFKLVMQHFPKELLLNVLANQANANLFTNINEIRSYFKKIGIRSDVEDLSMPFGAYEFRLNKLYKVTDNIIIAENIQQTIELLKPILSLREKISSRGSLHSYVALSLELMNDYFSSAAEGLLEVKELLLKVLSNLAGDSANISLFQFSKWLENLISTKTFTKETPFEANMVEILSFDQINGRQFDYVAIVDMVHGRIPKDLAANQLLDNSDRIFINNLMPTPVFSVNESYILGEEPNLPTFEELEQNKFYNAIKSASKGLLFTAAKQDQDGRDQPKSEYFDVVVDTEKLNEFNSSPNKIEIKFEQAKRWLNCKEISQLTNEEIISLTLFRNIKNQRDRFMQKLESESILEVVGDYSFKSDATIFRNRFARYLGLDQLKPLSGTRVESLARCRFSGFVESMLKIDSSTAISGDIDNRILGKLAHKVLEIFYANNKRLVSGKINKSHREQIASLLYKYGELYFSKALSGHQAVMWAYVQWLETALFRLVSNLANNPPIENVVPQAMEMAIGVGDSKGKYLASMPLFWEDEIIYFGGIIDRFDEGEASRVVVDYKLSSAAAISRNVEEKRVFHGHFQLPLYLKLLEYHYPTTEKINLYGYLASISDGAISPILGLNRIKDLRRRIINDSDSDSLTSSLKELINPVLQGAFPADISERCDTCKFKRVCRVSGKESA